MVIEEMERRINNSGVTTRTTGNGGGDNDANSA